MDFRSQTLSLPSQLRWAAELGVPALAPAASALVVGMGGSGISGDFASVLAEGDGHRVSVSKGYLLPGWVENEAPLVVAVSYSGNTEETLSAAGAALDRGLPVVGISSGGDLARLPLAFHVTVPGGNQPRASLGYLLGSVVRVLHSAALVTDPGLAEAAEVVDEVLAGGAPGGLVEALTGRIPIVWAGSPITAPVAQRWKTQLNENAKAPAWWSTLPEADHNEIVGWASLEAVTRERLVVVPLRDREDHPRVGARFDHTRRLTGPYVSWAEEVWSRGEARLARMLSLATVADLVTLDLAHRYGVDPEAVALIEDLKRLLGD
jgi:glucose/mannose-6-phosphate isomerase